MTNNFTPTQAAMLKVLSDGKSHTKEELHACLPDELGDKKNIRPHLTAIRKKLRPAGQDIVSRCSDGEFRYSWVRLINVRE